MPSAHNKTHCTPPKSRYFFRVRPRVWHFAGSIEPSPVSFSGTVVQVLPQHEMSLDSLIRLTDHAPRDHDESQLGVIKARCRGVSREPYARRQTGPMIDTFKCMRWHTFQCSHPSLACLCSRLPRFENNENISKPLYLSGI